ncbi:PAS domain S-box protein [Virgibacillus halophilus]|uniref:PAS domain S-box protein n=2 Tax=Tigheibacillus halophilus TaxID=361280 RepID=A0ABU5C6M3_9BACI|nr:PAS domain S-box protein [Virgibacillus halophilus]
MYYQDRMMMERQIIRDTAEGIMVTNKNLEIVDVNPAFSNITGYTKEEVSGNTPKMLQSGKQSKEFYQEMWVQIKKNGYWQGEIWNKRKNGEIYPELLTISPIENSVGSIAYYVGIFNDISQKKNK